MLKRKFYTLKDHFKESQLYLNRTVAATVFVAIVFAVLLFRLAFLQIYQHDLYKTLSLNNQIRFDPITPARGLIFDRNGVVLADNVPAFSLEITPEHVSNLKETIIELQKVITITDAEVKQFFKTIKYKKRSESIPIRINLNEEEVATFSLEKYRFSGVEIAANLIRHYPLGEPFAHVLGYIGPISEKELEKIDPSQYRGCYHIGKTGVEKYYERELHGNLGYQHIETDVRGRTVRILDRTPPMSGSNLHLTIDSELQKRAYEALGEYKGSVVAIEPNTGEILAFVSKPSFDPNAFVQGIDVSSYRTLHDSPDRPLYNRALLGTYPPGSTIKPIIALQALDLGVIHSNYSIFDPGYFQLSPGGRLYRDMIYHSTHHGHGWVNMEKAIIVSCDTFFYSLAHKLGINHLNDIFDRFGLGKLTGIDLPGEAKGINPSAEWKKRVRNDDWYAGDTVNVGIGQGTLTTTPLQMAQVAAILATRGQRYTPHLLRGISRTHTLEETKTREPVSSVAISNSDYWNSVISAMQKVAHEPGGTAYRAHLGTKYRVAGKTGTAQVFSLKQNERYIVGNVKEHLRDHSWFIGFSPVKDPKIALAVLVENKLSKSGAEVARSILDNFFGSAENSAENPAKNPAEQQQHKEKESALQKGLQNSSLDAEYDHEE